MKEETGSFRDPAGKVFYYKNKILRKLSSDGVKRLEFIKKNLIIEESVKNNFLVKTKILNSDEKEELKLEKEICYLEHDKIPYISYPYEWSFAQLKEAALFHLDFNLFLLNHNTTLIDASAYNIQFVGNKPIFIDVLSLKKYEEGEPWQGHKQFCENFLNPLFLKSKKGLKFNNWFKGNIEGIETSEINKILGFFDKFSYNVFVHIYLLNKIEEKFKNQKSLKINKRKTFLKKKGLVAILNQLRNYIFKLKDFKSITTWDNYSSENSYSIKANSEKKEIVENFFKKNYFDIVCDLGCNDGEYSQIALKNNCSKVIGFDYDLNAIEKAFIRSKNNQLDFLPLFFDASNPSSNLGWNEIERMGFNKRAKFDCVIALAFEHHLAIAKNIPLNQVVKWIVSLAPKGLIEYVPKNDITVKKMLELKGDIFSDYTIENFEKNLNENCNIVSKNKISETGRVIYEFEK